jgi:hypothetical protein
MWVRYSVDSVLYALKSNCKMREILRRTCIPCASSVPQKDEIYLDEAGEKPVHTSTDSNKKGYIHTLHFTISRDKYLANVLATHEQPEDLLRLATLYQNVYIFAAQRVAVRLSALHTGRTLLPGNRELLISVSLSKPHCKLE